MVANQLLRVRVQGQRVLAAWTIRVPAAAMTQQHGRVAAAIAKHQRLLAARQRGGHRAQQRRGHAVLQVLGAHVDDPYLRRSQCAGARTQMQAAVAASLDVRQRFE